MNVLRYLKRIILGVFAAIACVIVIFGIRSIREPYREYIVPQNYVGKLSVIVDPSSPKSIDTSDLLRYHYVIRFPADGVLRVNNAWGVHPMAHEEWKYPDGSVLRATKTGPSPGRVQEHGSSSGVWNRPGMEHRWEILPEGKTASR
jgi:hypothetical protein